MSNEATVEFCADEVKRLRQSFITGKSKSHSFRVQQLRQLKQFLIDHETAIVDALASDLGM
jgi:aldehyde dehydrogenase (NAD+)